MKTSKAINIFVILLMIGLLLAGCNLPTGGSTQAPSAQEQTQSAQAIAEQVSLVLTQTAQAAPQVVVITATPEPTTANTAVPPTATSVPPTPTKTAVPVPCNLAHFVDDITVEDGTSFIAGSAFTKTWRIQNIGTCTWTTSYVVYFYGGDSMSSPATVAFPKSVKPGEYVDISVPLVAPGDPDTYLGKWFFRSGNNESFGTGVNGSAPVTAEIKVTSVPKPHDTNTVYDFVAHYCDAQWRTNAGFINCPSSAINYTNGTIMRTYAPIKENGEADDEGAIITIPAKGGDGMIQGQFPKYTVHSGDYLRGAVLCSYKMTDCSVKFEILAQEKGSSTITSLGTWDKTYDNSTVQINLDLSAMDGKEMIFYIKVYSLGSSTNDYAQWMALRITHP